MTRSRLTVDAQSPAREVVAEDVAAAFAVRVVEWQAQRGRHDLPWQRSRDPYAIWVSEIMLQQTQVATVVPYYERFMVRFPDVVTLARADIDEVMRAWAGLGYYSRARNLHRAALAVVTEHGGLFPDSVAALAALPGVGRSTAAAIAALAFGARGAILDGNVKRVLCRHFAIEGDPGSSAVERRLWTLAEVLAPHAGIAAYTQGMMDIGATVCLRGRPRCEACPLSASCAALALGRTDALPQARQRKPLPARSVAMLVLSHGARVLLEKRPQTGIWAGLWSLPEAAADADPALDCARRFGARDLVVTGLPRLAHGFTHFKLDIVPWHIEVGVLQPSAGEAAGIWLPLEEARGAAVPVPVRRILEMLT